MARKHPSKTIREFEQLLSKLSAGMPNIRMAFVIDCKEDNVISVGNIGEMEIPLEPLVTLLNTDALVPVSEMILPHLSDDALEYLRDAADEYLAEREEMQEEEDVIDKDVPCTECQYFTDRGYGFGNCKYHEKQFDGQEANGKRFDGGCRHCLLKERP